MMKALKSVCLGKAKINNVDSARIMGSSADGISAVSFNVMHFINLYSIQITFDPTPPPGPSGIIRILPPCSCAHQILSNKTYTLECKNL